MSPQSSPAHNPTRHAGSVFERARFSGLIRSEWVKTTSLPSTVLLFIGILAAGLGGSMFLAVTLESSGVPSVASLEQTVNDVLSPMVILGQIIAGIVGVMSIGAEYSSGSIQPTLIASPRRLPVLGAKTLVVFSIVTVVGLVTAFASWTATYPFYAEHGLEARLDAPGVLVALLGSAAYLGLCAVFGVGIGTLLRSTTIGAVIVFVVTLLGPILASVLPYGLFSRVVRVLMLGNAGDAMSRVRDAPGPFLDIWTGHISAGAGWMIALAWTALALTAGALALMKRDA